jgi:hypothetical protein
MYIIYVFLLLDALLWRMDTHDAVQHGYSHHKACAHTSVSSSVSSFVIITAILPFLHSNTTRRYSSSLITRPASVISVSFVSSKKTTLQGSIKIKSTTRRSLAFPKDVAIPPHYMVRRVACKPRQDFFATIRLSISPTQANQPVRVVWLFLRRLRIQNTLSSNSPLIVSWALARFGLQQT